MILRTQITEVIATGLAMGRATDVFMVGPIQDGIRVELLIYSIRIESGAKAVQVYREYFIECFT